MGDMLSLIEKAQQEMDQDEAQRAGNRLMSGKFDLEDFLSQMQQMKRLGPVSKLLEMIPGINQAMAGVDMSNAEHELKHIEAMIYSMTLEERRDPALIKASRKRRIAAGSGTSVQEINVLLKQFREMQTMMKQFRGGGRNNMLSRLMGQVRGPQLAFAKSIVISSLIVIRNGDSNMVRIRLTRTGLKKQPSYRVVVADRDAKRDGRILELIGHYNPRTEPLTFKIQEERALYWLSVGAQPSDAVRRLLEKQGTMNRLTRLHGGETLAALVAEYEGKPLPANQPR